MKTLRLFAILLILALSFSLLTSCDVLGEIMGSAGGDISSGVEDENKPDDGENKPDDGENKPDDGENKPDDGENKPEECKHDWQNGECTVCGVACEHDFDENEKCTVCGVTLPTPPMEECKHEWSDGVCPNCGYECEHDFDPDNDYTCTICGAQAPVPPECKHEWQDGVCKHCKNECEHVFSGDTCEVCGTVKLPEPPGGDDVCAHEWYWGVCTVCGFECEHDFGNDVTCSICGDLLSGYYLLITYDGTSYRTRYEITLGEFISEHLGTTYEDTVASGGYWMTVDYNTDKVNLEKDSPLCNHGMILELYLIGGGSVTPPPTEDCAHEWIDDYCPLCGKTCQHDTYVDSVCTECGRVCSHSWWTGGECGYCGLPCEHEWDGNMCLKCSYTCMHEGIAESGYCGVCGYVCYHNWNHNQCEYCGMICNHVFDGPTCVNCGYMSGGIDNPICVTYDGQDYYVPYSASFADFLSLCLGTDYHESTKDGYWVAILPGGEVPVYEYDALSDFGHFVTIELRKDGTGGGECYHPWWNAGFCGECGYECQHGAFTDGMCGICDMPCTHNYSDGVCVICGYNCYHAYFEGACHKCGKLCEHSWNDDGACSICNLYCYHSYKDGYCTECGKTCPHDASWYDGTCVICGYVCEHRAGYDPSGLCYICGSSCNHSWNDSYCHNCGTTCMHEHWTGGVCDNCNKICDHSWQPSGFCHICNEPCEHNFSSGYCLICNHECSHSFYDGVCVRCGTLKESSDDERVTISLSIQDGIGSDSFSDYTVSVPYSIALYNFFGTDLRTEDGATMHVPYETNFLVRVNGKVIDHEEFHYTYITGGEHIVIYRCYSFELETVVNGESSYVIYNTPSSVLGAELMYAAGLDPNTNCTIWINGAMFESYTSFADTIFPLVDEYCCFIRFECLDAHAGTVRLEVSHDGNFQYSYEAEGVLNLNDYFSYDESFHDFIWTLSYPNGDTETLYNLDRSLVFDYDYVDYGYNATVYKLDMKWDVFFVSLVIDDYDYGQLPFHKSDNMTVRDILNVFGVNVDYGSYDWSFFGGYGNDVNGFDSVVYEDLSIYAHDNRPYLELSVDGTSYKINHTETLTLTDALDIVNATYGTSFSFDGYIWYAYSNSSWRQERVEDPYLVVVEAGYSATVSGKTLNSVVVYFNTDFGPINEDGMMEGVTFGKNDEWRTPELGAYIIEMTRGAITFTGEYEYRIYDKSDWSIVARYDVNSIDELFALNLEEVSLYAKYEINYDKICGTYVRHDEIIFVTENTIATYYRWNNTFTEAKTYTVTFSAYMVNLTADDGTFSYNLDSLTFEAQKIEDGAFCALVFHADFTEMYLNYEDYLMLLEYNKVDAITDKDGNALDNVGESGLYFVYVSEISYT